MAEPTIIVNDQAARELLDGLDKQFDLNLMKFMDSFMRVVRDKVRDNIESEGETFGEKWEESSKWVKAKTGQFKVLHGQGQYVQYSARANYGSVFFASPGQYTLTQHEAGFTTPPSNSRVDLDLKAPYFLSAKPGSQGSYRSSKFSFMSKRASVTPARKQWPTEDEAWAYGRPYIERWLTSVFGTVTP